LNQQLSALCENEFTSIHDWSELTLIVTIFSRRKLLYV